MVNYLRKIYFIFIFYCKLSPIHGKFTTQCFIPHSKHSHFILFGWNFTSPFFLGGMINNLFYSVRKQRDLLSETEGWECHIYLSRANKSYSIIPCTVSESSSTVTFLYHSLKSYFSLATQNSGWKWDGDRFLNWYLIRFSSNIISR